MGSGAGWPTLRRATVQGFRVLGTTQGRGAILNPSATLTASTKYRATLSGGTAAIRDLAGNPLSTGTWDFTTGTT